MKTFISIQFYKQKLFKTIQKFFLLNNRKSENHFFSTIVSKLSFKYNLVILSLKTALKKDLLTLKTFDKRSGK
jgi:hypothetical protein